MSTLAALVGWDFVVVSKALKALRQAATKERRTAILKIVEAENQPDGARLRSLAEAAFLEEWNERRASQ